ncbi:hypothetical protein [Nonomuraea guangzhouensis]|nr:hypothetical protein [Nonomuraea guangzhouensis]
MAALAEAEESGSQTLGARRAQKLLRFGRVSPAVFGDVGIVGGEPGPG